MLLLTRKSGEKVLISPAKSLDLDTPVRDLFANGPIELMVCKVEGGKTKLGIEASPDLLILREEVQQR